jgi:hypothetical protein
MNTNDDAFFFGLGVSEMQQVFVCVYKTFHILQMCEKINIENIFFFPRTIQWMIAGFFLFC